MSKKYFILLIVLFVAGLFLFIKRYYQINKSTIISTIKPPSQEIKKLPLGSDLDKPLTYPAGYRLAIYAKLSGSPRVLAIDPYGVLVTSLTGKGKLVALPDMNKDGISDKETDILTNLNRPHGIEFKNGYLYVAETDKVVRYFYDPNNYKATTDRVLFSLPEGGRHFTRTIKILDNNLYTSVGSSCDTCQESDEKRASILISDLEGGNLKVFAKGLRNTVFITFDKEGRLWGNDMGRDFLGDNLPPDDLNMIISGRDYGWPFCYGEKIRDAKFETGKNQNYCGETEKPAVEYPAHVAPLGITFMDSDIFPNADRGKILSAFHGSWNSSSPVGYKIVKVDPITGIIEDFISGWIRGSEILGRPVDLILGRDGNLFISDDKANLIYILTKAN